jgi:hypothetical protein
VNAIKSNMYALFGAFGRAPSVDFLSRPGLVRWRTPIAHPLFQGVLLTGPADNPEQAVRETRDYFEQYGTPIFSWWFSPEVDAAPWATPLRDLGFVPDGDPPGMALALDALSEPAAPASLSIARAEDLETFSTWNRIFAAGYEIPPDMAEHFYDLIVALGRDETLQHYIAYLDGVPVATSSLWLAAGVAGIYNVATLPEARGQGSGAAVTIAPLRDARAKGYHAGILQSSEMGFKVYQQIGFRHLCALDHYVWAKRAG